MVKKKTEKKLRLARQLHEKLGTKWVKEENPNILSSSPPLLPLWTGHTFSAKSAGASRKQPKQPEIEPESLHGCRKPSARDAPSCDPPLKSWVSSWARGRFQPARGACRRVESLSQRIWSWAREGEWRLTVASAAFPAQRAFRIKRRSAVSV